jgi:adenosylcobyric acid synthase
MGRSEAKMPALAGGGNVYGSYVHGIFDAVGIADTILKALCARKNVSFSELGTFDPIGYKEAQYNLLADTLRNSLDMEYIYKRILLENC